jgi:hypothetical protein
VVKYLLLAALLMGIILPGSTTSAPDTPASLRTVVDGGIRLPNRVEHRLLVVEQKLAGAKIGLLHNRIEPDEIQ